MSVSGLTAIVPNNNPFNDRILQDANKLVTIALPATASTVNTANIDLQVTTPYPTTETVNVKFSWTASANGNSVNATIVLQHTAANTDGTNNGAAWANIPTLGADTTSLAQGGSSTAAGACPIFKLPPGCKRFIRAQIILPANTADLSDSVGTLQLLF